MSDLDGEVMLRILRLVEAFEDDWKRGKPRSLEALMRDGAVAVGDGTAQTELLLAGLAVELKYRRRRGEVPVCEDYERRFPEHVGVVRSAFADEPTPPELPDPTAETSTFDSPAVDKPAAPGPKPPPDRIGKYEVVRCLGDGGQGSAYLARDPDLGRFVVLKRYHASGDAAVQEGQALARVRSRFTAQCYDLERQGDEVFLVMEYIPGNSLSEVFKKRPLAPDEAVRLVEQVAEGLEAVHASGLVHRDIKPSNIVLGDDGVPRLVDFGLAAHLGSAALRAIAGSPPYMAPEQARGQWERIDARTDVYGLGGVLYAALTGQPPHPGDRWEKSLEHARHGTVTPRALNGAISKPLERIVQKALAADPVQRFATAAELRRALRRHRLRRRRQALAGLAGLLALTLTSFLIWYAVSPVPVAEVITTNPALLSGELAVRVWTPGGAGKRGWRVDEPGALPVRPGEWVHLEARLNQPAYAYLLWLDGQGQTVSLYPWLDRRFGSRPPEEESLATVESPAALDKGWPVRGPGGLETALLLVRRTPLSADTDLAGVIGRLPPSPLRDPHDGGARLRTGQAGDRDQSRREPRPGRGSRTDRRTAVADDRAAAAAFRGDPRRAIRLSGGVTHAGPALPAETGSASLRGAPYPLLFRSRVQPMNQARTCQIGISFLHIVTGLVISAGLGVSTTWPQEAALGPAAPPKLSEAERARRLEERDRLRSEAMKLANAGKLDEAVAAVLKELAVSRGVRGGLHDDVVTSLESLARLHEARADWSSARKALADVVLIRERQPDRKDWRIGHARRALTNLDRRAAMSPDQRQRLQEADRLNRLQDALRRQGKYAEGIGPCRKAVEIRGDLLGQDNPDYATSLNNLARLYWAMGDRARAEPLYRQALAIQKEALGADHPDYAACLNNLAVLYKDTGDFARAEPLFREALAIKRARGASRPGYATCLDNLALLYQAQGDSARAEPLILEALDVASDLTRETSAVLGERQRLRMYWSQRAALDLYLSLGRAGGPRPADLYRRVLDWKGAAEARRIEDRPARDRPELAPSLTRLALVRGELANLAFRDPPPGQGETWRRRIDELREAKEDLEADLAARSADYRGQKQAGRPGPDEVAAALPAETALVDFLGYTHFSPPQGGKGPLQRELRLLAFVARRGWPVALVPLGPARAIDGSILSWRRALEERRAAELRAAAAELGRRIWEPLRPHLGDARTVLIAPDGNLAFFPFAALPGGRPGSYLIEDLAIGYVASGRSAIEALTDPQGPAGLGLLAVGDVDFRADPGQPGPSPRFPPGVPLIAKRGGFRPLPGTGPEARRAVELFHATFAGQPTELLTGAEPTEAALKRRLDGGRWRAVHLGTHGFFESPARIAALRAEVRREDPFGWPLNAGRPGEDGPDFALTSLLHSGVVLAGGDRDPGAGPVDPSADAPAREDGILTAEEVMDLDLRGCELVVLSACETGLGALEYGQGVLGLQRAFQTAGARAVVASLWSVNDAATSVLMEQFYTNLWDRKLSKLEALRQAQSTVLNNPGLVERRAIELAHRGLGEKAASLPEGGKIVPPDRPGSRSDPALWAAFVLGGDGR